MSTSPFASQRTARRACFSVVARQLVGETQVGSFGAGTGRAGAGTRGARSPSRGGRRVHAVAWAPNWLASASAQWLLGRSTIAAGRSRSDVDDVGPRRSASSV